MSAELNIHLFGQTLNIITYISHLASKNSRFYHVPANMEEVQSGYLYKSPPQTLFKSLVYYLTISPYLNRAQSFNTALLQQNFCVTSCFCELLQKSWKWRYFVLSKTPANKYELKFFKDENRREKPLGQINLYQYVYKHVID